MSWVFCTSGQAINKAGRSANSTITASNQALASWSDEVEEFICNVSRVDMITNYNSLKANGKEILQMLASSMIAQNIIGYDIASYPLSRHAETILDLRENEIRRCLKLIEDDKVKTYLQAT